MEHPLSFSIIRLLLALFVITSIFAKTRAQGECKSKQLLIDVIQQGGISARKSNKASEFSVISVNPGGKKVLMSALQDKPLDPHATELQFDNILQIPASPYNIYLKLHHGTQYLGHIIIELNESYASRAKNMLAISVGDNNSGGTWTGAGFNAGVSKRAMQGEYIECTRYKNGQGQQQSTPLFKLEETFSRTPRVLGEVRGRIGQHSGFYIRTRSELGGIGSDRPVIGRVISGLDILLSAATRDNNYVKALTFIESGLVVLE